jgi:hypothetical protein
MVGQTGKRGGESRIWMLKGEGGLWDIKNMVGKVRGVGGGKCERECGRTEIRERL